ncbi:MAG: hypothetical protein WCL27_14860 [Betaproteobacteria bacterium]
MSTGSERMIQKTELEYDEGSRKKWSRTIRIGRWFNGYLAPILENLRLQHIANSEQSRAVGGRLSLKQVQEVTDYLVQVRDLELRRDYFNTRPVEKTLSGLALPLVVDVLEHDKTISTVLNIGAYYSFVDHLLARKYPNIQFTAVDLLPSMEIFNAEFTTENLHFSSCYALDAIKNGNLRADVTLFSATAAEIMNAELRQYLKLLSTRSQYVVLSEPVYPLPDGRIINPASVSVESSLPAYAQPDYLPHPMGPVAYVHNYREMLHESGFVILHYHAFRPDITDLGWVLCIAKSKGKS